MFGFKKKKAKAKAKQNAKSDVPSKSQYKDALENVVGKNGIDEDELEELTGGLDIDSAELDRVESPSKKPKQPDTMSFDDDDVDLDALLDIDEDDELNESPESEELADDDDDDLADEPENELSVLKQKPVKVVDESSKRKRELQDKLIDDVDSDDFDGLTTDDALALVSDVEDEPEDEEDDFDINESISDDDDDDLLDDADDDNDLELPDEDELVALEEEEEDDDDELVEDEPIAETTPAEPERPVIRSEEAFNALDPVQQTILRQLSKMDTDSLKTQAQMVEENLYMQGQIREWSNAYAAQMRHLNEWQDYATKLKDLLVSQNDEFEDEKDHLNRRHQIQMRNLRASLEADYTEREDKIRHDQRIARDMVEEASKLIEQAREHDASSKSTIDGLRDQIKVLTTRPMLPADNAVPIAPSESMRDIVTSLGLKEKANNATVVTASDDSDDVGDLFDDENW